MQTIVGAPEMGDSLLADATAAPDIVGAFVRGSLRRFL
jgi:hypothetical protein